MAMSAVAGHSTDTLSGVPTVALTDDETLRITASVRTVTNSKNRRSELQACLVRFFFFDVGCILRKKISIIIVNIPGLRVD